jgi:hypothetical protein
VSEQTNPNSGESSVAAGPGFAVAMSTIFELLLLEGAALGLDLAQLLQGL